MCFHQILLFIRRRQRSIFYKAEPKRMLKETLDKRCQVTLEKAGVLCMCLQQVFLLYPRQLQMQRPHQSLGKREGLPLASSYISEPLSNLFSPVPSCTQSLALCPRCLIKSPFNQKLALCM